ncbi:hypothetical protein TSUD_306860 [Trifolium subterraneum]|uniref:Large ribosomal subunit protein uL4m n=1 Tax=Trifolium subterraneum TaxID=3900 RepID=A0A2Z6NYJ0_TRISU|nr:hypothetical protein TSUD_306860 [Trifolium subterraneum]
MAAFISKRLLRSYGSLHSLGRRCFDSPNAEKVVSAQHFLTGSMIQRFSTSSILTPGSDEGAFPSDLLSKTPLATSERDIGLCQDLLIPVTNFHNEDKGFMVLAGDVFDLPIRKDIIHRVVLWQRAKRQQGTHSTKTISEVSGTGRKPWNQKGTGRARHGSLRGPQLLVFEDLEVPTHKTKNFLNYFKQLEDTKKLLIVDEGPINEKLKLATQNLHYVNLLPVIGLNVYSILLHDTLVMSKEAVNRIVGRMHTPISRNSTPQ